MTEIRFRIEKVAIRLQKYFLKNIVIAIWWCRRRSSHVHHCPIRTKVSVTAKQHVANPFVALTIVYPAIVRGPPTRWWLCLLLRRPNATSA